MSASLPLTLRALGSSLHRAASSLVHRGLRGSLRRARAGQAPALNDATTAPPPSLPAVIDTRFVLVVDTLLPQPDRDSGSLRMLHLLQLLRAQGRRVLFMADDGNSNAAALQRLADLGINCLHGSRGQRLAWLQANAARLDAAILSRHHTAGHWLPTLRRLAPRATLVFDSVDLHFLREQREAKANGSMAQRLLARWTRRRELRLFRTADCGWVVSQVELALLAPLLPQARVQVLSNIVDTRDEVPGFAARRGMLFVGAFGHRPNVDAVAWLLQDILPLMRQQLPQLQLHLVGADMPDWLRQQATALPEVQVHGHVPDLEPLLDGIRVGLAPLRYGAGVKGKVNLGLANGMPMVATPVAVEGMALRDGDDILVAESAAEFARQACRLHEDAALWARLADNGRQHMRSHFSRERALAAICDCLPPA